MKTILLFLVLLSWNVSFAQDTTVKEWKFTKQIEFWTKWQNHSDFAEVSMPSYIRSSRKLSTQLPVSFDSITDNPLRHGASYLAFRTRSDYKNKVSLFADLYAEHRGVSYGLFNQENTVVYPIIRLEARDTFTIFSNELFLQGRAGQFLNERMDQGLMIYNIDLQGMQLQAAYKSFRFQYTLYGDLYNGIGLNIDDLESFSLSRSFPNNTIIGASWVTTLPPYGELKGNYSFNLFASRPFRAGRLYSQLAYRPISFDPSYDPVKAAKKTAFVIGLHSGRSAKKLDYSLDAAFRYYGFAFNLRHKDYDFKYRDPASDAYTMYANTVGKFLYPLRKFETPFSQWAVFTEYSGYDVASANITGNLNFQMMDKFDAFLNYDLNYIYATSNEGFAGPYSTSSYFYPFYNIGLSYIPVENVFVKAAVSNKAMNLDISYPTHYLFKKPCFELSLFADFR